MRKYEIPSFLYSIGVSYHATGTIDHTLESGKIIKVYDFFKVDRLTTEQEYAIRAKIKDCSFCFSVSQYAPEQKKVLICIPKKAFYTHNMKGF